MPGPTENIGTMVVRLLLDDSELDKGTSKARSKLLAFGGGITDLARKIDATLTAAFKRAAQAAAALAAASAFVGATFEREMKKVQAVSGASAEDMALLTKEARRIGEETLFSATEAATAMENLAQAGLKPAQIIQVTADAMALAGAAAVDLDFATGLVAATMQQFGLGAESSGRIVDVLTSASQASLLTMTDLGDAMRYAGAAGSALGLSLEDTTVAVAAFRDLGLTGEQAGTNLRATLESLVNPTKKAYDIFEKLGIRASELDPQLVGVDGALQRLAKSGFTVADSFGIFSSIAGGNVARLVQGFRDGTEEFTRLGAEIDASAGLAGRTFAMMTDDLLGRWDNLTSSVEELLLTLYDALRGPLIRLIETLVDRVGTITSVFESSGAEIESSMDRVVDVILRVVDAVILLSPYWKLIAEGMFAAWVGAKGVIWVTEIGKFAAAVGITSVAALRAAIAALVEFAAALAASTAGISLIVAGVIGLTAAYVGLTSQAREAAAAQRTLNAALVASDQHRADRITQEQEVAKTLEETQVWLRAEVNVRNDLDDAQKRNIAHVLGLTAAQAMQEIQTGDLVVGLDGLYAVTGRNVSLLQAGLAASEANEAQIRSTIKAIEDMARARQQEGATEIEVQGLYKQLPANIRKVVEETGDFRTALNLLNLELKDEADKQRTIKNRIAGTTLETKKATAAVDASADSMEGKAKTAKQLAKEEKDAFDAGVKAVGDFFNELESHSAELPKTVQSWVDMTGEADAMAASFKQIGDFVPPALAKVEDSVSTLKHGVSDLADTIGTSLLGAFDSLLDKVVGIGKAFLGMVAGPLFDLVGQFGNRSDFQPTNQDRLDALGAGGTTGASRAGFGAEIDKGGPTDKQASELATKAAADGIVALVTGFAEALPGMIGALVDALPTVFDAVVAAVPKILGAVVDSLPDLLDALTAGIVSIVEALPAMITKVLTALPDIIVALAEDIPIIIDAIVKAIPQIIVAIVDAIPEIIIALVKAIPEIGLAIILMVPRIIFEVLKLVPMMIANFIKSFPALAAALWDNIKEVATKFIDTILEALTLGLYRTHDERKGGQSNSGFLGGAFDKNGVIGSLFSRQHHTSDRHASGIEYVPRTMSTVLEPGEAVLDAMANAARFHGNRYADPPPRAGAPGGHTVVEVSFEGQVVDAAMTRSRGAGRMPELSRALRGTGGGVKLGFGRGPWNPRSGGG